MLDGVAYRVVSDSAEVIDPARLPPPPDPDPDDEPDGGAEDPDRVPDTPSWDLPPLPDGDVTIFRAEAFRRLPTYQFMQVDDVYYSGLRAALHSGLPGAPSK